MKGPPVAVITVVRNARSTVEAALESVLAQDYPEVRSLVVDGASTDGTRERIEVLAPRLHAFVSEPDGGIYDAMNKALSLVRDPRAYVCFLNADDRFSHPGSLRALVEGGEGADLVHGLVRKLHPGGFEEIRGGDVGLRELRRGMACPHQGILCRRRVFDEIGAFDRRFRIAADYDWVLRAFLRPNLRRRFLPVEVALCRADGVSGRRLGLTYWESWRARRRHFPDEILASTGWALWKYGRDRAGKILRSVRA